VRFRFLTSTPRDIARGSGTYVGISVLAGALQDLGHGVDFVAPARHFPVYTAERLWFNRGLRADPSYHCTVGFDMDGYRIAGTGGASHVASLKGVIADEVRFERGLTRFTMDFQARCERLHAQRADRVVVSSQYSADCARQLYQLDQPPIVVPELIDLGRWRHHLEEPGTRQAARFTVLFVGRFYRRKRVDVLLRAVSILRMTIPDVEVRIVGNGPCRDAWRKLAAQLRLGRSVSWCGDISRAELAAEYARAHVFCMPSVQEGFGIVLLEAMAAGVPIVGARAGAVPEVAPHAVLVEPESAEALAAGIVELYESSGARTQQSARSLAWVERFDAPIVARQFIAASTGSAAASA
jgi:glycosyltransferase involved in cell wall biosynthesis